MSNNLGVKLGIEGEKEFRNALRDINNTFKVLGSELNLVSSQFDKNDKSIEAITSRNKLLNKEIDTQKDKISTLEKALKNSATSFGENDKRTQAWQIQLNNAKAGLNGLEKELKQNDRALDNVADEFNDAEKQSEQFNAALKKSSSTAVHADSKFSKLGSTIGKIGIGIGAGAVAIGAAAVAAGVVAFKFVEQASNLSEAQNVVSETFKTSKTDILKWTEEVSATTGISQVNATKFIGSMGAMLKSSGLVEEDAGKMAKAMVQLTGDMSSFYNLDTDTAWGKLRAGISGETEPLKQLGINMSVANLEAFGMANGMKTAFAKMTQGEQTTLRYNYLLSVTKDAQGDFGRTLETSFPNQLRVAQMQLETMAISVGTVLLPSFLDGLKGITNFAKEIMPELQKALKTGDFTKLGEVLASGISEALTKLLPLVNKLIPIVINILGKIGQVILDNLPMILNAALSIVMAILQGLISALPQIANGATQLILTLLTGIIENLPTLVKGAILMVVTLANGIAQALPELIPKIVDAVILIVKVLIDNMDLILDAAFQIIVGLAKGLLSALPRLIEALPQLIISIVTFITDNLPMIIEVAIQIIVMLAIGLIQALPQLLAKLPEILVAIVIGLLKIIPMIVNTGVSIINGLWEGMKSMFPNFTKAISDFFSGVVDGIKSMLGIKSPSKIFAGIGENMGAGLGEGFLSAMSGVEKDMQNAIPTNFNINAGVTSDITGVGATNNEISYNHTGTIRVEGVNTKGDLTGVVDIIIDQLRREVRV